MQLKTQKKLVKLNELGCFPCNVAKLDVCTDATVASFFFLVNHAFGCLHVTASMNERVGENSFRLNPKKLGTNAACKVEKMHS